MTQPYFRAHPWHGVSIGPSAPAMVTVYIEMTPEDTIKYELDKETGILKVDRPQLYSNVCPAFYGLIPQTYCGEGVAKLTMDRLGRKGIRGDGDPLDICILTDKRIATRNILVDAIPIGGLRMIDGNEADDKIIAIMKGDNAYHYAKTIDDLREAQVERLRHYFLTYKQGPDAAERTCEIGEVYGREDAHAVIDQCRADYAASFGGR